MNPHRNSKAKKAGAICSRVIVLYTSNLHAETTAPRFTMNAITDAAHGDRILAADYEEAIDTIDVPDRIRLDRFYAATNLCVAYILVRDLDKAEPVCDDFVSVMETKLAGKRSSRGRNYLKFLAIALSNRGVLNALGGDEAAAREDFNAALEVNAPLKAPKINLARLGRDSAPNAWMIAAVTDYTGNRMLYRWSADKPVTPPGGLPLFPALRPPAGPLSVVS